jgi:hypothetical protein
MTSRDDRQRKEQIMNTTRIIHPATADATAMLESDRLAYVKPVSIEGRIVYAIHAADGTHMGWAPDRDTAFAALRQQDFEPVSVN